MNTGKINADIVKAIYGRNKWYLVHEGRIAKSTLFITSPWIMTEYTARRENKMTDSEKARINAICKVAHIDDIGDLSDGFHTFNDLYYQRCMLFASIVKQNRRKAWKSHKHEDGEPCFGGGWFIVGVDTPEGSYTFHYEDKYWDLFDCDELPTGKHWDGHTDKDVTRLFSLPGVHIWKEGSTKEENFEDLKKALIFTIENTKSNNSLDLFKELLVLLWTEGFAAGQVYALDVEENY